MDDPSGLATVVAALRDESAYGLDTEFHGERSYFPQLALLQCAWPGGVALIDPLALDVSPLAEILDGDGTMVTHAGDQDLAILERATGTTPTHLFDTQVAAGFVGLGSPGLADLVRRVTGEKMAKGQQLTDWTRRPLDEKQCQYAAADVEYLLDLYDILRERLEEMRRLDWALDECDELLARDRSPRDPDTAWWKIKGSRRFRGETRRVAQTVAAWRERTAVKRDLPPRFVLSDLALAGIAQRRPRTAKQFLAVRGLDRGGLNERTRQEVLDAVGEGIDLDDDRVLPPPDGKELDRSLGPAVTVILAWANQRASDLDLHTSALATRADVVDYLRDGSGRLSHGWRHEVLAETIDRLLDGHQALALRPEGGLRLHDLA